MSEVRVQIKDQGNHPQKIVEDIKKILKQSQSFGPLDLGEMRELVPRKLKQEVDTGVMYSFKTMWVEQLKAGVFLIIITISKHKFIGFGDFIDVSKSRILAKVSRIPIPRLKEACQNVIRSLVKVPEKVEELNLPKTLKEELSTQCQWFNTTNRDGVRLEHINIFIP